jgi:hypothetical protein
MLKRIGVGAAVAWSAPIITSINTPAFAASGAPCTGCAPFDCNNPPFTCQDPKCPWCVQKLDASCSCANTVAWNLNGFGLPPICASDSDCIPILGSGSVCITMAADCDAVGKVGCAACQGGSLGLRTSPKRGQKVRTAR